MQGPLRHAVLSWCMLLGATFATAADLDSTPAVVEQARQLVAENKKDEAVALLKQAADAEPQNIAVWRALDDLMDRLDRDDADALAVATKIVELAPESELGWARFVMLSSLLGRDAEVERGRKRLFELHDAGKTELVFFERDKFLVGETEVVASEFYELTGTNAVRYRFLAFPPNFRITTIYLASYDAMNQRLRDQGLIAPDGRGFHLDLKRTGEEKTYAVFAEAPTYAAAKALAIEVLEGKREPLDVNKLPKP